MPDTIINYFSFLKKEGMLGTAYLLIGDNFELVKTIINLLSCSDKVTVCSDCWDCRMIQKDNHPDIKYVVADNQTITIEQIREVSQFLATKSFRLPIKIVIVKDVELLCQEAANAFLKTLEEPPKNTLIILCAKHQDMLLPTIVSRCRKLYLPFKPETQEQDLEAKEIARFLKGDKIEFKDRKNFSTFLFGLINLFRDQLVGSVIGKNNELLKKKSYEIILGSYPVGKMQDILEDLFKIYSAHDTINEKLALHMIREKLQDRR